MIDKVYDDIKRLHVGYQLVITFAIIQFPLWYIVINRVMHGIYGSGDKFLIFSYCFLFSACWTILTYFIETVYLSTRHRKINDYKVEPNGLHINAYFSGLGIIIIGLFFHHNTPITPIGFLIMLLSYCALRVVMSFRPVNAEKYRMRVKLREERMKEQQANKE